MNKQLLDIAKDFVVNNDIKSLDNMLNYINNNTDKEYNINYQHMFIQLLNLSALKNRKNIIEYLLEWYDILTISDKIALRQGLIYPKYIIKDKNTLNWYSNRIKSSINKI